MGVENGEVAGLLAKNAPEYLPAVLGILAAGATVAPVNPAFLPHEIGRQLGESGVSTLVVAEELAERVAGLPPVPGLVRVAAVDEACGIRPFANFAGDPAPPAERATRFSRGPWGSAACPRPRGTRTRGSPRRSSGLPPSRRGARATSRTRRSRRTICTASSRRSRSPCTAVARP